MGSQHCSFRPLTRGREIKECARLYVTGGRAPAGVARATAYLLLGWDMSRRVRPLLSLSTAFLTVVSYAGLSVFAAPARAADPDTVALRGLVTGIEAFVPGLAGVGRLAQPIPTLAETPAEALGLATLLSEADTTVLGAAFDDADTVDQLVDAIDGASDTISDGREVSFTAAKSVVGTVTSITMGVHAERTIASTKLGIADDSPQFSLAAEDGVQLDVTLDAGFVLNYDSATTGAWVTRGASTPSLTVGADASIPDAHAVQAGLGILAVRLESATFALDADVSTSWSDPDNDGRLYFDEPGGVAGDGELSAAGAGAGLVTSALASGSLAASLRLVARPSTVIDLGDVDVTVAVDAPDLTTDTPQVTVTSGTLASVEAFLTLSTRDLAQGLAQAASTVMALQNATGTDLPFMRGDFANAVGAVEAITKFLEDTVDEPTPASPEPGLPDFASLQDMLEDLDAITGTTTVDVAQAAYDAVKKKVAFRLDLTRATGPAVPLNPAGEKISGTATYTDTKLTDGSATFTDALIGRQVVAGTSSGIVLDAESATVLVLDPAPVTSAQNPSPTVYWNGGKPANGTSYSVSAADPKIGAVELGNALESAANGAIRNANAKAALATVTPTYTLNLPVTLDLRAPDTTDCDPGPGTAACPFSHTANGLTRIIESLPLPADRIMLRTGDVDLLTADAPITTAVDVDATVGFLGVKVKGTLKACTVSAPVTATCTGTPAAGDHLLTIALNTAPGADADGDISFPAFVAALTQAQAANTLSTLVDVDIAGRAYADLTVEVPGAPQFFGGTAPSAGVTVSMPDITAPGTVTVTPSASLGDLGTFDFDPDNPLALFGAILADLQAVQGVIGDFPGAGALDTKIPLVGKSFNDLIAAGAAGGGSGVSYAEAAGQTLLTDTGKTFDESYVGRNVHVGSAQAAVVGLAGAQTLILAPALAPEPSDGSAYTVDSELQGLINTLQDQSSSNLQNLLDTLSKKLGLGSNATFEVIDGTPDTLKIKLHWVRSYANQAPVNLAFELPSGTDRSLIGAQGQGLLNVSASGEIDLALLIPLDEATFDDPASALKIDPTESGVKAGVSVNGDGVKLTANLGPFEASLGNPTGDPGTELQAGLGVDLSSAATSPQTLSAFVGGLDIEVTGNGVDCDGTDPGSTDLALCAVFPTYINGTLAGADAAAASFKVMLPVNTTDLADTVNIGGAAINGNPRLDTPDDLLTALQDAALNLTSFGEGFYGYMEFLENALRTASFDGKLPLVGKDLQAGSDFVGDLRSRMQTALAGVDPLATNAGQIRTFLKDEVEPEMPRFGSFSFDVECVPSATLATVGKPTVTPTNEGVTTTAYRYKVVAYTAVDGAATETIPSDASDPAQNGTLGGAKTNKVDWTAVARATGYRVYRAIDSTTDYFLVADLADGTAATWTDTGAANGAALTAATFAPCPDSTPPDEVQGFTMTIDVGQGDPSTTHGCKDVVAAGPEVDPDDKACLGGEVPFDLGIPGLSLKSTPDTDSVNGIEAALGWRLHLKVGLNRDDGFFVQTQDTNAPEFLVGAKVDVGDLDARVAFINVDLTNNDEVVPELVGAFSIDLKDGPSAADCTASCPVLDGPGSPRLTLDKLGDAASVSDFVKPVLTANVDIDWHLRAKVGTGSAMPGISTDFAMTWGWTSDAPSDFGGLDIAFNNVKIDAGEFLGSAIKPIIKQVVDVFKPVQPVIDTLFEPVPLISDLSEAVGGDPVTIASLAQTFSTLAGGPDIQPFLDVLKNVRDLLKALSGDCGTDPAPCITVGSFDLSPDNAVTKDANPSTAASMIDTSGPSYSVNNNVKSDLNAKASRAIDANGADAEHPGFTFPFLDNPSSIFGLLVGQDVDLVKFDSGPLTLGFEFQQSFGPVYAPPPVNIVVGGGASVTLRVVAGFDTYGIRTAIEAGKFDAKILDSLFFYTTDDDGTPLPVVQFEGFLQAGASVSAVVIEVGVVGGIKLTISFFWNDPNNDGKFRFSEFLATALSNPICLFNVGGELSLFIKVFITLGISPFSVSFDFTLVEVVILDFNLKPDCTPPPPKLGGAKDGVLYLFAGKFGGKAQRAPGFSGTYPFDANNSADEVWVIRQVPAKSAVADPDGAGPKSAQSAENAKVTVTALGITEDFDDAGGAIHTVVLDGRGYTGDLQVTFNGGDKNTPFSKKTVVATGSGADVIRTGIGAAIVDSGSGDDQVTTLERTDLALDPATAPTALVSGGLGVDALTVGNGKDTVLGDRGLVFHNLGTLATTDAGGGAVSVPAPLDPNDVDVPSSPDGNAAGDGGDQIAAGLGGSTVYGNGGDDKIGTANDNKQADLAGIANPSFYRAGVNTIVGGGGSDRIKSGSASDFVYTGAKVDIGQDDEGSGDLSTDENSVDTGTGSDTVYGSNAKDYVTTHSLSTQTATAYGGGAADVLIGGLGTDKLYGGRANDYLIAGPAEVSSDFPVVDELTGEGAGNARRVTLQPITPPVNAKTLVGGGGKDRIYGVDGPATIYGDHEVDACARQSDPVSKEPGENPVVAPAALADRDDADLILGGSGVDTVQAGGGDDYVHLFASDDVACAAGGEDSVFGGSENDLVYGGSGPDKLYGEADDDELYANTGDDFVYGGTGLDRIQGNAGADFLTGDADTDLVIGGTSKAGEPDTGDRIYGDTGTDTLVGDNADADVIPAYPADLANTDVAPAIGGADKVYGGDHDDIAYGGLAADEVQGGSGDDYLEGNNASDSVFGEAGADDVIGGSSQEASAGVGRPDAGDTLSGGAHDDVIAGDNAQLAKVAAGSQLTKGRDVASERSITLLDLGYGASTGLFGGDTISGGEHTDVILGQRGVDLIHGDEGDDYAEGGPDADTIDGDDGDDDLVGGSYHSHAGTGAGTVGQPDTGDTINGGAQGDVVLGDNGALLRDPAVTPSDLTRMRGITERSLQPFDLDGSVQAGVSFGADLIHGNADPDVLLGQSGTDRMLADAASDYAEGGPHEDWIEGGAGSDDLVGGSSTILSGSGTAATGQPDAGDVVWGQEGDDVATGDNALLTRVPDYNSLTYRVNADGVITERRALRLLDLSNGGSELTSPHASRFGADQLSGQGGTDVLLGQDGDDAISGGSQDDYAEGQGNADVIYGDRLLAAVGITPPVVAWPGSPSAGFGADGGADGQDDLLGGSSRPGFRDAGDTVHGDGVSDFILGDNGTSVRTVDEVAALTFADRVYTLRYPGTLPAGAAKIRHSDPAYVSTRFCTTAQATCEPAGASGGDLLYGEAGDDFVYGQDGDDTVWGGTEDDDIYGELGNDALFGEDGEDAILGDRGGVRDVYENGSASAHSEITAPPALSYDSRLAGSVSRVADLLHDVNGDAFVGSGAGAKMVYDGIAFGGNDRIRGGNGHDNIHAGIGDDLVNGDSGGDTAYGGDGADVMWGGRGCDQAVDTMLVSPDCYASGVFVPEARGTNDRMLDYLFGGKGATSGPSVHPTTGNLGADVIDWRPRGTYDPGTGCTLNPWPQTIAGTTVDPCSWLEMTNLDDGVVADNQHHQGIDWQYGGWDRDIMQGDVTGNGPNPGDRMLDWNGAYNLYTACNAAYGGFNDVRQISPDHIAFINQWSYGVGAGQTAADVTTAGTSAFVETAIVYTKDLKAHGSGKAYPSTPGHFDDPNACAP